MDSIIKYKYYILISFILLIFVYLYKIHGKDIKNLELFDIPHFIERKSKEAPTIISGVPLVIYESWHSNQVPEKMKDNIYRLLEVNPEFDYYLYSDEKCREFILDNYSEEVINAFDMLRPGAYKSDLWRYCILYKNGGVYLDIKYYSVKPLVDIISDHSIIFVKDRENSCVKNIGIGIYNAFMVSYPKNPIFKYCINEIIQACKFKLYNTSPIDITGPCLLSRIIQTQSSSEYIKSYKFKFSISMQYNGKTVENIYYNDEIILTAYPEYRNEQKIFQATEHYDTLWRRKDVYII